MTKEEILTLLEVLPGEDYMSLRERVGRVRDELVNSDVEFPCVAYWIRGHKVWASNRVERGAERITLEVYRALRPGLLSRQYPESKFRVNQMPLEL